MVALETSGPVGSVAVAVDGRVRARRYLEARGRHAAALPEALRQLLAEADATPAQVTGVAVGAGPGSFTGVRVAAAAANGFAHALGCPVHPVSSLAAAAVSPEALPAGDGPWDAPAEGPWPPRRRVLFDARGDRLFTAVYHVTPGGLDEVSPPTFARLGEVLTAPGAPAVCGDGALRHRDVLEGMGLEILSPPAGVPTADGVLRALAWGAGEGPVAAGAWEPRYLRETGAVRARGGGA